MSDYRTEIFWSDEDEGYIAIVPELPGCSAFGETMPEAAEQIEIAKKAWIDAQTEAGNDVPAPQQYRPEAEFSGKLLLRMPKSLHRKLQQAAQRDGVSLNTHCCHMLAVNQTLHDIASSRRPEPRLNDHWLTPVRARTAEHDHWTSQGNVSSVEVRKSDAPGFIFAWPKSIVQ